MRELILATVGAVMLIALGLATVNATERHDGWEEGASVAGASTTANVALRLAD